MKATGIWFRGHACFTDEWVGFDEIKPINLLVGRNNSGKSRLLDLVATAISPPDKRLFRDLQCRFVCELTEDELRRAFPEGTTGGALDGNHWYNHGRELVGRRLVWTQANDKVIDVSLVGDPSSPMVRIETARLSQLAGLANAVRLPLDGKTLRRLAAERDIVREVAVNQPQLVLSANGQGATNVIRRFITAASFPRELVQERLLGDLNKILGDHGTFAEIQVRQLDQDFGANAEDWEVFLGERSKGLVPLSQSGSGLKTLILVLLNLVVAPHMDGRASSRGGYVFAFEELENSLHPTLLRRLLRHIESYAEEHEAVFFLTTHSPVALDVFAGSPGAQVVRVQHDGARASTSVVSHEFERHGAISDLGAKASDILQANGIVWVEGPSDAIYLNRWIELVSNGKLREGRDYQCAYFGGALLARMQAQPAGSSRDNLVNLLRLNANIALIADSDRTTEAAPLKPRLERMKKELEGIPGSMLWITEAREIENYLPLESFVELSPQPERAPKQYESFWPKEGEDAFWGAVVDKRTKDKVSFARLVAPKMTLESMKDRFDWGQKMNELIETIRRWNT